MSKMAGIVLVCLPTLLWAESQPSADLPVEKERVSGRVIVVRCPVGTNVTAINTRKGVVIVDTHLSPTTMQMMKSEIEQVFQTSEFSYVITTHGDWDHCSGNQVFPDATIIGHETVPNFMRYHRANAFGVRWWQESLLSRERNKLASTDDPAEVSDLRLQIQTREQILSDLATTYVSTPPTVTFRDRYNLAMGDLTVELIYCGPAHTITDIFAYIPEEKVLVTGDVFCSPTSFCFTVSPLINVPRLLGAIDYALQRGVDAVVPGHGSLMNGGDLQKLRDRLASAHDQQAGVVSTARTLEQAIERNGLEDALRHFRAVAADTSRSGYFAEEEFYLLGNRFIDKDKVDTAAAVFELACDYFPESSLIFGGFAKTCLLRGDTLAAIPAYERAYELAPYNRQTEAILENLRSR